VATASATSGASGSAANAGARPSTPIRNTAPLSASPQRTPSASPTRHIFPHTSRPHPRGPAVAPYNDSTTGATKVAGTRGADRGDTGLGCGRPRRAAIKAPYP